MNNLALSQSEFFLSVNKEDPNAKVVLTSSDPAVQKAIQEGRVTLRRMDRNDRGRVPTRPDLDEMWNPFQGHHYR